MELFQDYENIIAIVVTRGVFFSKFASRFIGKFASCYLANLQFVFLVNLHVIFWNKDLITIQNAVAALQ